jgi:hypothetical protein
MLYRMRKETRKMRKITLCIALAVVVLSSIALPVCADGPGHVYVDPSYGGNEDGTQGKPYNTENEGKAYLRSLPDGGFLYTRNEDGTWSEGIFVAGVESGVSGVPLPQAVLYVLLAILALGLSLLGWRFIRRARQVEG